MLGLLLLAPKVAEKAADSGFDFHIKSEWILPFIAGFILGAIVFGKATR